MEGKLPWHRYHCVLLLTVCHIMKLLFVFGRRKFHAHATQSFKTY